MKRFLPRPVLAFLIHASAASAVKKGLSILRGKIHISFVSLLLLSTLAIAQEWWETKPYIEWSSDQIYKVLNDSPWVGLSPAGIRVEDEGPVEGSIAVQLTDGNMITTDKYHLYPSLPDNRTGGVNHVPVFYRVRLITARPIREALLRGVSKWVISSSSVEDYQTSTATEMEQAILDKFMAESPDDLRVKGDEQHIIVALTLRVGSQDTRIRNSMIKDQNWIEQPYGREIDSSTLYVDETSLSTNTNRVPLVRYEPPGPDLLGARYYFPRNLPDGTPLISADDKDLYFETHIDRSEIKVKFDLRKMLYNGKLES